MANPSGMARVNFPRSNGNPDILEAPGDPLSHTSVLAGQHRGPMSSSVTLLTTGWPHRARLAQRLLYHSFLGEREGPERARGPLHGGHEAMRSWVLNMRTREL